MLANSSAFLLPTLLFFSGLASVPLLREALVLEHALLTRTQLNDAIAIGHASRRPLDMYGWSWGTSWRESPVPCPACWRWHRPPCPPGSRTAYVAEGEQLRGACSGIVIVSRALMVAAGLRLAPQATPTAAHLVVTVRDFPRWR